MSKLEDRIGADLALAKKASGGPWQSGTFLASKGDGPESVHYVYLSWVDAPPTMAVVCKAKTGEDAEFIAKSRMEVPWLANACLVLACAAKAQDVWQKHQERCLPCRNGMPTESCRGLQERVQHLHRQAMWLVNTGTLPPGKSGEKTMDIPLSLGDIEEWDKAEESLPVSQIMRELKGATGDSYHGIDAKEYVDKLRGRLTKDLLEKCAEAAHDAWMEQKRKGGFHSPRECIFRRWQPREIENCHLAVVYCSLCHPDMVPYQDLDELKKDYDREMVKRVLEVLEREGVIHT